MSTYGWTRHMTQLLTLSVSTRGELAEKLVLHVLRSVLADDDLLIMSEQVRSGMRWKKVLGNHQGRCGYSHTDQARWWKTSLPLCDLCSSYPMMFAIYLGSQLRCQLVLRLMTCALGRKTPGATSSHRGRALDTHTTRLALGSWVSLPAST